MLASGYKVRIFDADTAALTKASRDGMVCTESLGSALRIAELVIGCTGTSIINKSSLHLLRRNCLLVNAASSDIEFSSWELRANAEIIYTRSCSDASHSRFTPWCNLYKLSVPPGYCYLASGGFPINFDGTADPIDPLRFQLTRALMLAGALYAASLNTAAIVALDSERGGPQ